MNGIGGKAGMEIPEILKQKVSELEEYYLRWMPEVAPLVRPCFLNTIETTVKHIDDDYFVITGDIPAMWLRDSAAQITHYVRYASGDKALLHIVEGVLRRQAHMVLIDPYANAFNEHPNGHCFARDLTEMHPFVWERKYEVDSLCAPIYLLHHYWKTTGLTGAFDAQTYAMLVRICEVFSLEQHHENSPYSFERQNCVDTDTLPCAGRGTPVAYTGMTWSGFRPSDDRCVYGYLIPAQIMAVKALKYAAEMLRVIYLDDVEATKCIVLSNQIETGIQQYGIVRHPLFGEIYAYETDGLGNYLLMDDANCPSLLSLPYLGYTTPEDKIYSNTRAFILSEQNPFYYSGKVLRGVGSPHTPSNHVWPLGIIMQALTSSNPGEIRSCITQLTFSHAGTGYMHESVHVDIPMRYTRSWFAWANSLFSELLIRTSETGILEK